MPMESKYLASSLRNFLEENPDIFVRCNADGTENPNGEFWRARKNVSREEIIERGKKT